MFDSTRLRDIFQTLISHRKLERDRGQEELETYLAQTEDSGQCEQVIHGLRSLLLDTNVTGADVPWETKLGVLLGAKILIQRSKLEVSEDKEFGLRCKVTALKLLEDEESRVRLAAGEVLGALAKVFGPDDMYRGECKDLVISLIKSNLERSVTKPDAMDHESPRVSATTESVDKLFHDSAGWRNLETSMKCLQEIAEGSAERFQPYVDQDLLDLIFEALGHTNRFVRETGFFVLATIVETGKLDENAMDVECGGTVVGNPVCVFGEQFAEHMAQGLADNWSQVRMSACVASRKFLLCFPSGPDRERFFPQLLPQLCLNRYYMAEGVRIYSQDTWKMVMGKEGKHFVEKYIIQVIAYYVTCTQADNHAVREAACQCIAELAMKLDHDVVKPYIDKLLKTLLECFQDDSWPVRDMACVASGSFVRSFPLESKEAFKVLLPLFIENLKDPISSVRQGAAGALKNAVHAYGDDLLPNLMDTVKIGFKGVASQPQESHKYGDLETGNTTFGVAKKMRDNDPDLHENQQMYSCGSLAPKMHRGGGCTDAKFRKPSEPWELADGCVHLLAELAPDPKCQMAVANVLPQVADAARHKHYTMHYAFHETVCRRLPLIGRTLGKRLFKPQLEDFFETIFYAAESENVLCSSAGKQCIRALSDFLGPNIFRGRVEQFNQRYLDILDRTLDEPDLPAMCGPGGPRGPPRSEPMAIPQQYQPFSQQSLGGTPTGSPPK